MKVYDILKEGISQVLYHLTSLEQAKSIISNDAMKLRPVFSTSSETAVGTHKVFFLSASRSISNDYFKRNLTKTSGVIFELDGKKLSAAGFSGEPVDYWGPEYRALGNDEMEDRIFSDQTEINNLSKFINAVYIYAKTKYDPEEDKIFEDYIGDYEKRVLRKLIMELKKKSIPYYIFATQKDMLTLNYSRSMASHKKNSERFFDLQDLKTDPPERRRNLSFPREKSINNYNVYVHVASELLNKDSYDELSKEAKAYFNKSRFGGGFSGHGFQRFMERLRNIIHNASKPQTDRGTYEADFDKIVELTQELKRHGFNNLEDFEEYIHQKIPRMKDDDR